MLDVIISAIWRGQERGSPITDTDGAALKVHALSIIRIATRIAAARNIIAPK